MVPAEPLPVIATLDLGSSSLRCLLFRGDGAPLPGIEGRSPFSLSPDGTGSPATLVAGAEAAVDDCLARLRTSPMRDAVQIRALAWAAFAMCWLGVDAQGEPVTPLLTYADTRSGPTADALRQELAQAGLLDEVYHRTGVPIHNAYAPAQLRYLAQTDPAFLARVVHWQTGAAHLLARWTDRPAAPVSIGEAGWTGLFDGETRGWYMPLVERLGLDPATLPPLVAFDHPTGSLSAEYSKRWPELTQARIFLAIGDGAAANLGSGCTDPGRLALTIGTSGAARIILPQAPGDPVPSPPIGLWRYPVDRTRWLVGGALTDGGSLYAWLRETLRTPPNPDLLEAAAALPPDGHGLTVLPFLRGERSPGWATHATMTIHGITAGTRPAHLLRAGLEAVALRFAAIVDRLTPLLAGDAPVLASGGALAHAPPWRQILADVLGRPLHLVEAQETTARGAALLAAEALGWGPVEAFRPQVVVTHLPDPQAHARYRAAAARQEALYARLIETGPIETGGARP